MAMRSKCSSLTHTHNKQKPNKPPKTQNQPTKQKYNPKTKNQKTTTTFPPKEALQKGDLRYLITWTQGTWGKGLLEEVQKPPRNRDQGTREGQITWAWHKDLIEPCVWSGGERPRREPGCLSKAGQHSVSSRENLKRKKPRGRKEKSVPSFSCKIPVAAKHSLPI